MHTCCLKHVISHRLLHTRARISPCRCCVGSCKASRSESCGTRWSPTRWRPYSPRRPRPPGRSSRSGACTPAPRPHSPASPRRQHDRKSRLARRGTDRRPVEALDARSRRPLHPPSVQCKESKGRVHEAGGVHDDGRLPAQRRAPVHKQIGGRGGAPQHGQHAQAYRHAGVPVWGGRWGGSDGCSVAEGRSLAAVQGHTSEQDKTQARIRTGQNLGTQNRKAPSPGHGHAHTHFGRSRASSECATSGSRA